MSEDIGTEPRPVSPYSARNPHLSAPWAHSSGNLSEENVTKLVPSVHVGQDLGTDGRFRIVEESDGEAYTLGVPFAGVDKSEFGWHVTGFWRVERGIVGVNVNGKGLRFRIVGKTLLDTGNERFRIHAVSYVSAS
jgi:hypothetical protein